MKFEIKQLLSPVIPVGTVLSDKDIIGIVVMDKNGTAWNYQKQDFEIVKEESIFLQKGLPAIFGQELKSLQVDFK